MATKHNKCRFCQKFIDRKSKGSVIIDDDIKYQFSQLTNLSLRLKSYWEVVCVMCLRSLQLACDFQELLIDNEEKYRSENLVDEGVISEDELPSKLPNLLKPKPTKRKNTAQSTHSSHQAIKRAKTIEIDGVTEPNRRSNDSKDKENKKESGGKSKTDENDNEINNDDDKSPEDSQEEEVEKKQFKCFHCPKVFAQKKSRTDHILVHHIKRRYACVAPDCDHLVFRKYNLIKHLRLRHSLNSQQLTKFIEEAKKVEPTYENPGLRHN